MKKKVYISIILLKIDYFFLRIDIISVSNNRVLLNFRGKENQRVRDSLILKFSSSFFLFLSRSFFSSSSLYLFILFGKFLVISNSIARTKDRMKQINI